jgi:hypothetical protein
MDGKIQVKLTESAKAQFAGAEDGLPRVVPQGQTGIAALDQRAQQFGVERMERVFRPAGKHEPRHVEWGLDRWYTVHYGADVEPSAVAESYLESPAIEAGSPVYKKAKTVLDETPDWVDEGGERSASANRRADEEPSYIPNDPEYSEQWHYNNTEDNIGTPDADIDLPEAHNIEAGQDNVVISIVDGGLDLDHPEFEGMLWINDAEDANGNGTFEPTDASNGGDLNGVDDDDNGFVDDVIGYDHGAGDAVPSASGDHGTHVAGTVAAKNNNGQFGGGVAGGGNEDSGVRLMINQTFSSSTGGFAEAIAYCADNGGCTVSQNSWGYTEENSFEQAVLDAIDYLRANAGGPDGVMDGGIFVNAAGNSDSNGEWYPGFYSPSYAVAATNEVDDKASYSNYGSWVDIAAPGGNIDGCSGAPSGVLSTKDGGFGPLCGTSMAAPHVSGLIGLVVSNNPGLTNDQVENLLQNTGEDVGSSFEIGPRINAFNALAAGGADETPPSAIDDLATTGVSGNSVDLEWTAPGDDGDTSGVASTYDMRYSTDGPIDDSTSWADATQVDGEPVPDTPGTTQSMTVSGLPFGSEVYFGIRATDDFGNTGAIGNSPSGDTGPAPVLATSPDSLAAELESGQDTSVALTVTNDGAAESTLDYSFPDFAADALLARPDVERNDTSPVIDDAGHEKGSDPHAGIGHPVRTGAGGPDEFGYSWIDSNEPGGPSFAFNDISDVGTALDITDDFGPSPSPEVDLPIDFEFYGQPKSTVRVDNNGFLHFDSPSGGYYVNAEIPNTNDPNGVVAPFWDDLDPGSGGEVYTYHDESAGEFIVQWDGVPAYSGSVPMTFQIVLSEDGSIRYNILDIDEGDNDSATIGIEDQNGEVGLQVAFDTPYPEDSLSVAIAATPDFITDVTPASGTLGGGESDDVDVTFSAEDIEPGTYTKDLALVSNDPDNQATGIPSTLSVTSGPPAITLEPDSLDFGQVLAGNTATRTFTVDNSGGGPLEVSSVSFPGPFEPADSSDTGPFTVPFGEERDIETEFAPSTTGSFDGEVVVESDAENDPSAEVFVEGEAVPAPDIAVSPSAISDSLGVGDSSETTLTVENNGGSELEFSTTIASGDTPSTTAPGEVAATSEGSGSVSSEEAVSSVADPYDGPQTDVGQTDATYQLDDGTSENALGFGGQGDDFAAMWLNAFEVVEGAGTLTEISTTWGNEGSESVPPEGKEGVAAVYNDPNNDGDPSDAELLTQTEITVQDPGTNNFTTVSLPPTDVEGTFFIGVMLENNDSANFPMPMDESSEFQGASWAIGETATPGNFNLEDLSANEIGPDNLGDVGFPANWLLRAEGGANFVAVEPSAGTVPEGGSLDLTATFDASGLDPGIYEASINFDSNDPDDSPSVDATLEASLGPAAIGLEPDSLDFGSLLVGEEETGVFTISNTGGEPLEVSSVSFPTDAFSPVDSSDTGPFTIPFEGSRDIEVAFSPPSTGTFDGEVVVESNADNDPSAEVFVEGEGVPAPDIAVSPTSISDSLGVGDSSETTLTVENSGGSELEFSTTIETGSTPDATVPDEVAAPFSGSGSANTVDAASTASEPYDGQRTDVGQTATTYQLDDGTSENALGYGGQGDDFAAMWLNAFEVVEGAGTLTEISTTWGNEGSESVPPEGKEGVAAVYNDPNNDGDPSDAELLTQTEITVQDPGTNNFTTVSLPPTDVEGTFFIGVMLENNDSANFPMPMDESSEFQGASWAIGETATPGNFNLEDLSANEIGPDNLGDVGFPANWLLRAEGGANFVAVEPSAGTVPEGGSLDLTATFDATGLDPDIYEASINFDSNDPDDSPSVDATLEVSAGPAAIALEPDSLDFGSLLVGDDATETFTISNTGGEPLEVSSVGFPTDAFSPVDSADTGPFTIPFEGSRDIEVRFEPGTPDVFTGDIVVESNADNDPSATVFVEGEGLAAPDLAFSPDSLKTTLAPGETEDLTLSVSNEGPTESTLEYTFPDFAASALLAKPGVERNNTSPHKEGGDYDRSADRDNDPHAGTGHPVRTGAGGPDEFGYSWIDSNEPGGPSFMWNDISDEGTATGIGTEESVTVELPFNVEFYGEERDTVQISDNGYLNFGEEGDGTEFGNDPIPDDAEPNGAAFGFWEDLDPGEGGEVYYYHDESAGQFIVQYDGVPAWGPGAEPVFTFQIVLDQNGTIRYNYLSMDTDTEDDHASASIGIENAAGEVGVQVVSDAPYVEDSLSTVIAATPDFITDVTPASGTLGGGESEDVSVTFDATDIDPGTYETGLALSTNDLDESSVEVPSTLTVTGGGGDCPLAWSLDVATSDSTGSGETLTLGQGPNATAGLDSACGETEQPPVPPAPETDFRFVGTDLPGVELGEGTLVDIRPDDEPTPEAQTAPAIWRMNLQSQDYPVSMSWDADALAGATDRPVELVDAATGGDVVSVDMKNADTVFMNSAVSAVEVRLGQTTSHEMVLADGWNFKSMPVMTSDMSFGATMGPCHSGFAYTPGEGYDPLAVEDEMAMGEGYWFNCAATTHTLTGTVPSPPTADVGGGWNVIGPYADSVDVSSITSDPEGIVQSAFYGFDQTGGYMAAETLAPAQAYWVKTSGSGTLNFSGSGGASATLAVKAATSAKDASGAEALRLAVTDAQGHEATVRLAEGLSQQKLQRSVMPPKPPSGAFDVRFESGHSVASFDADAEASDAFEKLELQGVSYPLTLRLKNADTQGRSLRLERGSGQDAETRTLTAESPSVTLQSEAGPLKVAPRSVPDEFALNNSYPNPVSGQATIEYAVPEQSDVTVEVYDVLGRRVATLADGEKKAGEHSVRLDASDLSSGTYFYRMRAEDFTQTRRLVVVR